LSSKNFFFAGGGTGGHIYPSLAIAQKILAIEPEAGIRFFCSEREIDERILAGSDYERFSVPAAGLTLKPAGFLRFFRSFLISYFASKKILRRFPESVVVGLGGYVAAPVCLAAYRLSLPVFLINTDLVPGRANRFVSRYAEAIFVQFDGSRDYLAKYKSKVRVTGCPLRGEFENPEPWKIKDALELAEGKKILLITGASSGSERINETVCLLLERLDEFADDWQIVHLTGHRSFEVVQKRYTKAKISHQVLAYYDDMANLLGAADLVVGRAGAVSVAEYATAGAPSICIPYPHHKDMHQYQNAGRLVEAGAGVVVDDLTDSKERAGWLWDQLRRLMTDDAERRRMEENCRLVGRNDAAGVIAQELLTRISNT